MVYIQCTLIHSGIYTMCILIQVVYIQCTLIISGIYTMCTLIHSGIYTMCTLIHSGIYTMCTLTHSGTCIYNMYNVYSNTYIVVYTQCELYLRISEVISYAVVPQHKPPAAPVAWSEASSSSLAQPPAVHCSSYTTPHHTTPHHTTPHHTTEQGGGGDIEL